MAAVWLALAGSSGACGETVRTAPVAAQAGTTAGAPDASGTDAGGANAGAGSASTGAVAASTAVNGGGGSHVGGAASSAGDAAMAGAFAAGAGGIDEVPFAINRKDDLEWAHWPMPSDAHSGLPHPASYDTSVPGIVHDNVTGLTWQRSVAPGAIKYATARRLCLDLTLAGFDDWRVPTRVELVSILDYTRFDPAIDTAAFPDTPGDTYFSGTVPDALPTLHIAYVGFGMGRINILDPLLPEVDGFVRCVRADVRPEAGEQVIHYLATTDSVVDVGTGLEWERRFDGDAAAAYFLDTGTAHCQNKRIGGHEDWRLASIKEMSTLLDSRYAAPSLDPDAFPMAPVTQWFLVSTPFVPKSLYPSDPQSWSFKTTVGSAEPYPVGFDFPVRCVRDSGN